MKTKFIIYLALLISISACKDEKETPEGQATLNISMTDAPAVYNAVNIDVQGVAITGPAAGEINLNVNPGIYNLLDFTNGNDTLLATGTINAGTVSQIRLILGNNNTVVLDSVVYPLSTPSAQQSGLKLQIHKNFEAGVEYNLLLDFDAQKSIVEHGNGTYSLKPVIRVIETALSGAIKGSINPVTACHIMAVNGGDTTTTYCAPDGRFLLQGLSAGTYEVTLTPSAPFSPVVQNNIVVIVGNTTDMGVIQL